MNDKNENSYEHRILSGLRRIIRAVDIYSRKLNSELGLTTPQLLCLDALAKTEQITLTSLAKSINLGVSTVNGIIDRLETKGYLTRQRSTQDRRKVLIKISKKGKEIFSKAPSLLQDRLSLSLSLLSDDQQNTITQSIEKIVELMEVESVDSSPNLIPTAQVLDEGQSI